MEDEERKGIICWNCGTIFSVEVTPDFYSKKFLICPFCSERITLKKMKGGE